MLDQELPWWGISGFDSRTNLTNGSNLTNNAGSGVEAERRAILAVHCVWSRGGRAFRMQPRRCGTQRVGETSHRAPPSCQRREDPNGDADLRS